MDLITGCDKQGLEKWISKNFQFYYRREIKQFSPDYIEKCISRNDSPCKNPIIEVVKGQIIRKG